MEDQPAQRPPKDIADAVVGVQHIGEEDKDDILEEATSEEEQATDEDTLDEAPVEGEQTSLPEELEAAAAASYADVQDRQQDESTAGQVVEEKVGLGAEAEEGLTEAEGDDEAEEYEGSGEAKRLLKSSRARALLAR